MSRRSPRQRSCVARSQAMQSQAARFNQNTLVGLEMLWSSQRKNLPGRKVLFFLSGGFLIENRAWRFALRKLRDITNAAAKSGVVIYSMDTRGLVATSAGCEQ